MVRFIPLMLLAVLSTSTVTAAQDAPLKPDSLLNWLRIIDVPNTRLLFAADTNGFYFAVKVDADRDILFCNFEHPPRNPATERSFSLEVLDTKGRSLHDFDDKKESPDTVILKYEFESPPGYVTVAYSRGFVFPLRKHDDPEVIVSYVETTGGKDRVLLSQRIQLPPAQADVEAANRNRP